MGLANFTAAIKDKAYKEWFKNSSKSIFIQTTSELRDTEQATQKTSFLLRQEDITSIAAKLAGRSITEEELATINKNVLASVRRNRIIVRKDGSYYFPVINFETGISNVLDKAFKDLPKVEYVDGKTGKSREVRISDFFQKGHVLSIATNVAKQTVRNLGVSKAPDAVKKTLIPILEDIVKKLQEDDLASANVGSLDYDLYAKYTKNPYKYLVEMQLVEINQSSGRDARTLTYGLRRYFNPDKEVEFKKFFRTRAEDDKFIQGLITSKGSPSMVDMIESLVADSITGKKTKQLSTSVPNTKIARVKNKVDTTQVRKNIKSQIASTKAAIRKLNKAADLAKTSLNNQKIVDTLDDINIAKLQALLDARIQDQVKRNMGKGNRHDILNLRTGRFAESVEIKRLTRSRNDLITVFYSYMRSPYATFAEGGKQEYPRSRNPKTLISKSIRDLAMELAITKLRAVNI